ncbi:MAG: hypothetical protein ABIZ95_20730 [Pyrinomonadaceae bacterium]
MSDTFFLDRWRYRALIVGALIVLAFGARVVTGLLKRQRVIIAYKTMALGDSRDRLLELAGEPHFLRRGDSTAGPYDDLRYEYPYENWDFAFDRDGKMIWKGSCFLGEYCGRVSR